MKRILALVLTMLMVLSLFVACGNSNPTTGNNGTTAPVVTNPTTVPSTTVPPTTAPSDPWDEYKVITVAEAIAICQQTGETETTEKYYIRATVVEIWNDVYGNLNVSDETGTIKIYGS